MQLCKLIFVLREDLQSFLENVNHNGWVIAQNVVTCCFKLLWYTANLCVPLVRGRTEETFVMYTVLQYSIFGQYSSVNIIAFEKVVCLFFVTHWVNFAAWSKQIFLVSG